MKTNNTHSDAINGGGPLGITEIPSARALLTRAHLQSGISDMWRDKAYDLCCTIELIESRMEEVENEKSKALCALYEIGRCIESSQFAPEGILKDIQDAIKARRKVIDIIYNQVQDAITVLSKNDRFDSDKIVDARSILFCAIQDLSRIATL